jgi:hypothetical protein
MTPGPRVLEIGQSAIGIVVPEDSRHVRFFAASPPYDRLDGQLFRSAREVLVAARALSGPRPAGRARTSGRP